jgi:hypothetical protein
MENNSTCEICGNGFRMGWNGTVDGCDACLNNVRDADGYVYGPDEEFITLEDIETGEQEVRQRPLQTMPMTRKRYLKVMRPDADEHASYIGDLKIAKGELDALVADGEPGGIVTFELVEMTEKEYESLDEFQGW